MKLIPALFALTILTLAAQEKKPASSNTDKAAAEARDKLNKLKQDERARDLIKKAEAALKKADKNSSAAKAEVERMTKKDELPEEKEARLKLEKLKDSVDQKDMEEFERVFKEASETLREEYKTYREKQRSEKPSPAVPAPAPDPAPVSFDHVPAPAPAPLLKPPAFPVSPMVTADNGIIPGERDPRHPEVVLPPKDPRRRTWVLTGNVRIRRPFFALDADEVDLLLKEGEAANFNGTDKPPSPDPSGRAKREGGPFERIVARGRVRVMFIDKTGRVQVGRGGAMIYEEKSGIFLIKEWPEAEIGNKLLRGPAKSSVIKLSDITAEDPNVELLGLKVETLENALLPEDLPRTPEKDVPPAGAVKPRPGAAPSPAPR
jgi:hypothetical protein